MSASRLLSGRPSKRRRKDAPRIAVSFGPSEDTIGTSSQITYREERLQPSTGRTYRSEPSLVPGPPSLPPEDTEIGLDPDSTLTHEALHSTSMGFEQEEGRRTGTEDKEKKKKKKRKQKLSAARPLVHWKQSFRDIYLDELLRWEGRGDAWAEGDSQCYDCLAHRVTPPQVGKYRCQECFVPHLLCKTCCVKRHRALPLHNIELWTGGHFVKSSLKALGLRIQLNHLGNTCTKPEPCHSQFTVLHTNGLHEVAVDFCGCRPVTKLRQLLRRGFYPSSQTNPRTCATFTLLKQMHMLSLTSKCSSYDYYRAIQKLTNNTGIKLPRSKYRPLLRMILQWRHLKLLKRGGRGHDETGAAGTKEGELAILCPSCPHPGINLPEGWSTAPETERFLYFVVLCIDANFRLKNQLVSNYSVDPGLGIGMSYMVHRESFEAYVRSRVDDVDMTESDKERCGLQAVDQANTKYSKGLRYTGVSSVCCGRSEMIFPCSVGNLEKGEKYCVMDFAVASAIRFICAVLVVILSYDIACHWFANFASRIANYWPDELKPPNGITFIPLIPKLHENGHKKPKNHEQFSFNFCKGVGHTDGEAPERIWSSHNALGNATKTMGPGSRHDVLDDHFSHWNHDKYIGMGRSLMRKYQKAVPERNRQTEAHRGFTASLGAQDLQAWTEMCEKWEHGGFPRTADSPYVVEGTNITVQEAKRKLAEEEKKQLAQGAPALHEITPLDFIVNGLEIEDLQRRLSWIVKQKEKGPEVIAEERQSLRKKMTNWRAVQPIYMPGLAQHLHDQEQSKPGSTLESDKAEEATLWFPSSLPPSKRDIICIKGLSTIEEELRTAECYDSLRGICDTIRLKSRMIHFKNKNVRGQREGTRSRELINRVHNRARKFAARYRADRAAKLRLSGSGKWEKELRVLLDSDIRSPQDPERVKKKGRRRGTYEDSELCAVKKAADGGGDSGGGNSGGGDSGEGIDLLPEDRSKRDGSGQTRLTISWIWTVVPQDGGASVDSILRAEWCRSRARVKRATEEVQLLREEMRRVLVFLEYKAKWWSARRTARAVNDVTLAEGLEAYCISQESHQLALKEAFQRVWQAPLDEPIDAEESGDEESESGDEESDDEGPDAMDVDRDVQLGRGRGNGTTDGNISDDNDSDVDDQAEDGYLDNKAGNTEEESNGGWDGDSDGEDA